MKRLVISSIVIIGVLATSAYADASISRRLNAELTKLSSEDYVKVIVVMSDIPNYEAAKTLKKSEVAEFLRQHAQQSQKDIIAYLESLPDAAVKNYRSYWVFNGLWVEAQKWVVEKLAQRADVLELELDYVIPIEKVRPSSMSADELKYVYWNIRKIKADSVWQLGYHGEGVIIGSIDTGVEVDHPALQGKWAGYWYDGLHHQPDPYDNDGHGTHTMGVMVGGDGEDGPFQFDIGIAYNARFVAAKAFDPDGGTVSSILNCFQWYVTLVSDSGVNVVAVNNSWGSSATTSTYWWESVMSWRTVGIIPVFAIGNDGPSSGTAGTPGNFPIVIGVGATDNSDNIANFSSRGPAPNINPWNNHSYWSRPDWNFIKPDISAPGVGITSSTSGGGYATWDGTSMSTPHVTGVIALMFSKNPDIDYDTVYMILTNTADRPSQGGSYPNNSYGWGRINALAAVQAVPSPTEPNVVLLDIQAVNQNGNDLITPGDTINITTYLTNTSSVTAEGTQGVLSTTSTYATILNSTYNFGNIAHFDTVSNADSPFLVATDPNTPDGMLIPFTLHITTSTGYSVDYSFTVSVGTPRSDLLDVHSCQATFTLTDNGALGFIDNNQSQGSGFIYGSSGNMLFYGSLAAGNSSDYLVDNWYEHGTTDRDWQPTIDPPGRLYYLGPVTPPWYGSEQVWGMIEDAGHPTPQGLRAEFIGFGYDTSGYCGFITVAYRFINNGSNTLENLYFAWFIDFDIGSNPASNYAAIDTARRTAYIWGGANYAGIAVPDTAFPIANLSVIHNPTYIYPDTGMVDTNEWHFMVGDYHFSNSTGADDWSVVASVGPITLNPGDTVLVPFSIVGGYGLVDYRNNVDSARAAYYNPYVFVAEDNAHPINPGDGLVRVTPNPVVRGGAELKLSVPTKGILNVRIYDVSGRLVSEPFNGKVLPGTYNLRIAKDLANGVYFVKVKGAGLNTVKRLVVVR